MIALFIRVFAQGGLGAQVVVIREEDRPVADGGVLLIMIGELDAAIFDVVADLEVHFNAVLLLVGHDIDVVAVVVVLQFVPQNIPILLKINPFEFDAVHECVALELDFGPGLIIPIVFEKDSPFLHIPLRHGGLEEIVLFHMVRVAAEALHAISQGGHEGGPRDRELAGGADELQGQLAVGGIPFPFPGHAKFMPIHIPIQLDQDGHHAGEQLFPFGDHAYSKILSKPCLILLGMWRIALQAPCTTSITLSVPSATAMAVALSKLTALFFSS